MEIALLVAIVVTYYALSKKLARISEQVSDVGAQVDEIEYTVSGRKSQNEALEDLYKTDEGEDEDSRYRKAREARDKDFKENFYFDEKGELVMREEKTEPEK